MHRDNHSTRLSHAFGRVLVHRTEKNWLCTLEHRFDRMAMESNTRDSILTLRHYSETSMIMSDMQEEDF